jgi:hypothetical protein
MTAPGTLSETVGSKDRGAHRRRLACPECGRITSHGACPIHASDPNSRKAVHAERAAAYRQKAAPSTPDARDLALSRRIDLVTRVRPTAPKPGRIARVLAAAGIRLVTPQSGSPYADCFLCGKFAGLIVDGKHWYLVCGCRPARARYAAADLMADLAGVDR